jgi:hypothetical protein
VSVVLFVVCCSFHCLCCTISVTVSCTVCSSCLSCLSLELWVSYNWVWAILLPPLVTAVCLILSAVLAAPLVPSLPLSKPPAHLPAKHLAVVHQAQGGLLWAGRDVPLFILRC